MKAIQFNFHSPVSILEMFGKFGTRFAHLWIVFLLLGIVAILSCSVFADQHRTEITGVDQKETIPVSEKIPAYKSRFGRTRPIVAVVGDNYMTELTDYVIPYSVLTRSQSADVFALGIDSGIMNLYPALKIRPQESIASFDSRFPEGADYVVVPAVHHSDSPVLLHWLNRQASKGATVIGVCDGVWVVANAGLLKGKNATGFWYSLNDLEKKFKDTNWVRNRRYVADGNVVTTTAVTASIPVSLALVEAIAGKDRASKVARELGASDWNPAHDSNRFRLTIGSVYTILSNAVSFWAHEEIGIGVAPGVDEIKLALVADAYSRTYRSQAVSFAASRDTIRTANGLSVIPDRVFGKDDAVDRMLPEFDSTPAVTALDQTLSQIAELYGLSTAAFVALILEYPQY